MERFSREGMITAVVAVGALGVAYVWSAPGTLAPPAGPIEGTGRTLEEIYDRIGSLEAEFTASSGPWQYRFIDTTADQPLFEQVSDNPVWLRSIIYYAQEVNVYNGNSTDGLVVELNQLWGTSGGTGGFAFSNNQVTFDIVLDEGLYLTWSNAAPSITSGDSGIFILYRELVP